MIAMIDVKTEQEREREEARDARAAELRRERNAQTLRLMREGMPEKQARLIAIADHPDPEAGHERPPPRSQVEIGTVTGNGHPARRRRNGTLSPRQPGPRPEAPNYHGVSWDSHQGYWLPQISVEGKIRKLGHFGADDHEAAARCRDHALVEAWGLEKAAPRLNFPAEHPGALEAIARSGFVPSRPTGKPGRSPQVKAAPPAPPPALVTKG